MIRAAGLCLVSNRSIFLAKRAPEMTAAGQWSLPGGHVEPGETPLEAALREGEEELGGLPAMTVVDAFTRQGHSVEYTTFICLVDRADAIEWEPVLNEEHTEAGWFFRLPAGVHPGVRAIHPFTQRTWDSSSTTSTKSR